MSNSDIARTTSKMGGFTLPELLITIVVIGFIAFLADCLLRPNIMPNGSRSPANTCISNLRIIDGCKWEWALEFHKQSTDIPTSRDILPYFAGLPKEESFCPADPEKTFDSSYSINNLRTKPTCKINPTNHILP